jgi:hypothetical protein
MFAKLSKIYHDAYLSTDQLDKSQEEPDWDKLEKTLIRAI